MDRIYRALEIEYGGGGEAELRGEARSFLQSVQDTPETAFHAAAAILTPAGSGVAPDAAMVFGLSCLEKLATARWNELSDQEKMLVRSTAVAAAGRTTAVEAAFVRNKKAALVAQVALREFPQRWPTLVDEMLAAGADEERGATLELWWVALAELAEECTDADYNARLPAKRRTDVLKALNAVSPTLVRELFAFAQRAYASSRSDRASPRRLVAALRCLRSFATWVCWDSEDMRSLGTDPVELTAYLAANGELALASDDDVEVCGAALRAFRSLATSAHLDYDAALRVARYAPRFCEALYNKGCADFSRRGGALDPAQRATLWATLAACATYVFRDLYARFKALGATDFAKGGDRCAEVDDALAAYLAAAIGVLEAAPSRKAAEAMLPLWRDASRLAGQGKLGPASRANVRSFAPRILDRYARFACRRAAGGGDDEQIADDFEFVDDDEYSSHFTIMRSGVSQVSAALVDLDAAAVARATDARLRQLLAEAPPETAAASVEDDWVRRLEGLALVVERVVDETLRLRDETLAKRRRRRRDANGPALVPGDDDDDNDDGVQSPDADGETHQEALRMLDENLLAATVEWRPWTANRVLARLSLVDATRGVLRARGGRLRDVLRELFACLAYESSKAAAATPREAAEIRRKAAHGLLRLATAGPRGVAAQFDELRDGASAVLASRLLCDVGAQYVCEALVLFSNACADADKRRALLEAVVAGPLAELESVSGAAATSTPRGLLVSLGVLDAATHAVRHDARSVRAPYVPEDEKNCPPTVPAEAVRRALGVLLGVARRAAASAPAEVVGTREPCAAPDPPPGLADLVGKDASAAVLARVLPTVASLARSLHALWAPPIRDALRADPAARLALAPSLDEVRAKVEPSSNHKRDAADSPTTTTTPPVGTSPAATDSGGPPPSGSHGARWGTMLNELRSTVYQFARLWIERRCAFAADAAPVTVGLLAACGLVGSTGGDAALPGADLVLASTEHRHLASLLKHVLEPLFLRCPPVLYDAYLAPVARRVAGHLETRLALSFSSPTDDEAAYYAASGLYMPDWDEPTVAAVADASRRDLARAYLDVLQVAFATKGELAAPVALALKTVDRLRAEGDASARALLPPARPSAMNAAASSFVLASTPSKVPKSPKKKATDDGENGARVQAARERRAEHVRALRRFLLPTGVPTNFSDLATPVLRALWSAVGKWGDVPSCRAATKLAEICVTEACDDPRYWPYFAALFESAVDALVAEPAWLANAGCEYEFLALARAVYVALVVGVDPSAPPRRVPPDTPLRHDGPRQYLLSRLPGVEASNVAALEAALREPCAPKDHKAALHDLVLLALDAKDRRAARVQSPFPAPSPAALSPAVDASALRYGHNATTVRDLPGEMISSRQLAAERKQQQQRQHHHHQGAFRQDEVPPTHLADLFR